MAIESDPPPVARALQLVRKGDLAGAEAVLAPLAGAEDPKVLHLMGMIHLRRGTALIQLGRIPEAMELFRDALRLKPDLIEAWYALGGALHRAGQPGDAVQAFRQLLRAAPDHVPARLMLGAVLIDAKQPVEAVTVLRAALALPAPAPLKAALHTNLALALRRQRKDQAALENYDRAMALHPMQPQLGIHRAETLQNLGRHDEAIAVFQQELAREPRNPDTHRFYNDLLYRLGRMDEYLKSYDRAPRTRELQLGKALFLSLQKRGDEAHAVYCELLAKDPQDRVAAVGAANALVIQKRYDEAAAWFDRAVAGQGGDADLLRYAAELAILRGDPARALVLCEQGLAGARYDQKMLAVMSAGLRMMQDERDELLNGYDSLIQVFDLEPPEGFSSMDSFNGELSAYLEGVHPKTREYLHQSLRGGTQTPEHIFGAGHNLVDRLQHRIAEAVHRYMAGLKEDESHPFLSRRARTFQYAGSWSSRLRDCGFHVNHVHPDGWISSCYYVNVPEVVQDREARQGWIKFGEPDFDMAPKIPVRRTIQPVPGRLVLFPSYTWHGTTSFRSAAPRTTIAFDAVPDLR
jgi:tetratricopeptide (TPR) repeat protein